MRLARLARVNDWIILRQVRWAADEAKRADHVRDAGRGDSASAPGLLELADDVKIAGDRRQLKIIR
jgi:hypothetical protein